ncbi:MAG: hypothetical protein A2931_04095 [Candidatus Niyogibacteria bacterium RIFCSPLOWO2_01_FULL_45_48]|uniref:Uncharacterized protein n=2 Tax=Candidatus Niyogiibacteriota TaxID=1817912 RepID=A0A1G2EYC9_9BACT|nr:MAG: hypothetical protein A2931_04095 [Candidatus Niyogibacteria bacterium RIFCSPLOWO2_01_FULL_45_48]OGZ30522.1 MAG: hypothetical protein A3J00_03545 [Candidatus Niyogibacteria bacterium RIFCSPLOWO2_02_FULL_45_13]
MPVPEIVRLVSRELTALKPSIEERLTALAKKDALLPQSLETARTDAEKSFVIRAVSAIDREVGILELTIVLTTSRVLGFMVSGDDKESAERIKKSVEKETESMREFLKERITATLPHYSEIRYGPGPR